MAAREPLIHSATTIAACPTRHAIRAPRPGRRQGQREQRRQDVLRAGGVDVFQMEGAARPRDADVAVDLVPVAGGEVDHRHGHHAQPPRPAGPTPPREEHATRHAGIAAGQHHDRQEHRDTAERTCSIAAAVCGAARRSPGSRPARAAVPAHGSASQGRAGRELHAHPGHDRHARRTAAPGHAPGGARHGARGAGRSREPQAQPAKNAHSRNSLARTGTGARRSPHGTTPARQRQRRWPPQREPEHHGGKAPRRHHGGREGTVVRGARQEPSAGSSTAAPPARAGQTNTVTSEAKPHVLIQPESCASLVEPARPRRRRQRRPGWRSLRTATSMVAPSLCRKAARPCSAPARRPPAAETPARTPRVRPR